MICCMGEKDKTGKQDVKTLHEFTRELHQLSQKFAECLPLKIKVNTPSMYIIINLMQSISKFKV